MLGSCSDYHQRPPSQLLCRHTREASDIHLLPCVSLSLSVVGVEINARLVACANENLRANLRHEEGGQLNACVIKIPAENFNPGMLRRPQLARQAPWGEGGAEDFRFQVVLVDPPRAGLDKHTLRVVQRYDHVLYISCCPASLARDLAGGLGEGREVVRWAVLDHFPNTSHIEAAVYLRRKRREEEGRAVLPPPAPPREGGGAAREEGGGAAREKGGEGEEEVTG